MRIFGKNDRIDFHNIQKRSSTTFKYPQNPRISRSRSSGSIENPFPSIRFAGDDMGGSLGGPVKAPHFATKLVFRIDFGPDPADRAAFACSFLRCARRSTLRLVGAFKVDSVVTFVVAALLSLLRLVFSVGGDLDLGGERGSVVERLVPPTFFAPFLGAIFAVVSGWVLKT